MLRPAAALAAFLLLTAFGGTDRMYFEQQPGRWLIFEDLMLEGTYVQQDESENRRCRSIRKYAGAFAKFWKAAKLPSGTAHGGSDCGT